MPSVSRAALESVLRAVVPASNAKGFEPAERSLCLLPGEGDAPGLAYCWDGFVGLATAAPEGLASVRGGVDAGLLLGLIAATPAETLEVDAADGVLRVLLKGKSKQTLPLHADVSKVTPPTATGDPIPSPAGLAAALKACLPTTGEDLGNPLVLGITVAQDHTYSTDNLAATRVALDAAVTPPGRSVQVSHRVAECLVNLGELEKVWISGDSLVARSAAGVLLWARTLAESDQTIYDGPDGPFAADAWPELRPPLPDLADAVRRAVVATRGAREAESVLEIDGKGNVSLKTTGPIAKVEDLVGKDRGAPAGKIRLPTETLGRVATETARWARDGEDRIVFVEDGLTRVVSGILD